MLAIICLPRQFQITVVENVDERHVRRAMWVFPLYLLLINLFVLPIAIGGLLHFPGGSVDADTFVLTLPMAAGQQVLALFVFLGGLSAATGMVIVETIASQHDGLQRPGDPAAAALGAVAAGRAARPDRHCCSASGAARSSLYCCLAISTSGSPARPTRSSRSA